MFFSFAYLALGALLGLLVRSRRGPDIKDAPRQTRRAHPRVLPSRRGTRDPSNGTLQDILVAGSAQLVRTLMQHDLVDEYRLMVFPVVLGSGKRLFEDGGDQTALRLVDVKQVGAGVLILTYEPAR